MSAELSVIIPHKNISDLVIRCMKSIPDISEIEVFVCDDCSDQKERDAVKKYIGERHNVSYLQSEDALGGGHARNMGLCRASGKWIMFSDADDFFTKDMWTLFQSWKDSENDIIYFKVNGVDSDTLEPVSRGFNYNQYVDDVLNNRDRAEDRIRYFYMVPWGKMIRRSLIVSYDIKFEEIRASNDVMFSTIAAYNAKKIQVCNKVLYTVTSRSNSLVKQKSRDILRCRYMAYLRQNKFLCVRGKRRFVIDLLRPMRDALLNFGIAEFTWYFMQTIKNKVNPFSSMKKLLG